MAFDPYANSATRGDSNSGKFLTFNWGEKKVTFFKPEAGKTYSIDIIPFRIASKKHPAVAVGNGSDKASIGDEIFSLPYNVHRNVGPRKLTVVCPGTIGKPCPICELADRIKRDEGYNSENFKSLKAKERAIYNIVMADDEKEKFLLLDESYYTFEKPLLAQAKTKGSRKGKDYIHFGDITEGWTISFSAKEESIGKGGKFIKLEGFDLDQRDEPHDKSLIKEAIQLDEYLIVKTYDELEQLMTGDAEEDEGDEPDVEPEPEPKASKASKAKDDDEDDAPTCPHGKKFGKDYDRDDDKVCGECEEFRECRAAYRKLKE